MWFVIAAHLGSKRKNASLIVFNMVGSLYLIIDKIPGNNIILSAHNDRCRDLFLWQFFNPWMYKQIHTPLYKMT